VSRERHVKILKNGRNQAGADPPLIIEPVLPKSLLAVLATLLPLEDDFAPISDLPPDPVDL
jgi:antitoxin VapB